ncbi:protein SHORTAGE IN CHIASMATA 1 [Diospyros lotus]|uniref:protein SHORTAGE IN CHIASMATA 1 n=1 Tax=Diospyros lotus TaxID=55363 RepID=UPI00225617B6|nr:protein SHORTAGE IN CHIASMATA 1 [Diospyros lotus]
MRTRFLSIDYNAAPIQSLGTLDFLRFPLPHLPPSVLATTAEDIRYCFEDVAALSASLEIPTFPIDAALSKFFSDVLPGFIDVEASEFANTRSCSGEDHLDQPRNFGPRSCVDIQDTKEKDDSLFDGGAENDCEAVEFEMIEIELSLENAFFFEEEKMQPFIEVLKADNNIMDMLDPVLMPPYLKILESCCSVDDIVPEYCMAEETLQLDSAGSAEDRVILFPLLEVDDISLGILTGISMEEELLFLENIEPQAYPQRQGIITDGKEFFGYLDIDIFEYLADHCLSNHCVEAESACSSFSMEKDLISIIELSHKGNSEFQLGMSEGKSIWPGIINFEEIQFLNFDPYQFLDVFYESTTVSEADTCEPMFVEDSKVSNFNELVVSLELTLVDETFKSLPVPILSDHDKIRSLSMFVDEILAALRPQPPSVSDGIYLDWHYLGEDYRNCDKCSSCWRRVLDINNYDIDSDPKSINDGMWIFDFVFSGNTPNGTDGEDGKEMLPSGSISPVQMDLNDLASSQSLNDGNGEVLSDINAKRIPTLIESITPFNDLNFFLNPREAAAGGSSKHASKAFDGDTIFPAVSSTNKIVPCATPQHWEFRLHEIKLSDDILELIDNFKKSYLALFSSGTVLAKTQHSSCAMDDTILLGLPTEKLMDCIMKTNATLDHGDDNVVTIITLCIIKQMAWYLCYYGIHTTYQYMDKLCRRFDCLKFKLNFIQTLIEDMHEKVETDITISHPSLSVIQSILQSNINNNGFKVLIVADQVFWWQLKMLLTSMRISYNDQLYFFQHASEHEMHCNNDFVDKADVLLHSDCCLISNENISASFPFEKFSIILEYGGSCGQSRVSTISPKVSFPGLHFLKLILEEASASKALCDGVDMPQNVGFMKQKLEELLNLVPCENKYDLGSPRAADQAEAFCMPLPIPCISLAMGREQIPVKMPSFPDMVVIVNTQNFDKEMIISRRSTYQKILEMEKQGAQVVERDLKLPVDVIISSAICLVWYDCRNIRKKATPPDDGSSSLPLWIENIAANILTSLSFTFSSCILVFEGESRFLAAIMESSDELYAAAASLRVELQIFCSYSPELTDEIILNCVKSAAKLTRQAYPKMPESETLAESFLTTFPSINPLSAHAILASIGSLAEFLEWSHENRICALQKYHVSEESIALFSSLCRYGEREDSRSAMTDCSSSVSSAHESENCYRNTISTRKKAKYISNPHKIDVPMDGLFHFDMPKQFPDGSLNDQRFSKQHDTWIRTGDDIFDDDERHGVSPRNKLFRERRGSGPSNVDAMTNSPNACKQFDSQKSRRDKISNEIEGTGWRLDDELFSPQEAFDMGLMNKLDCHLDNNSVNLPDDMMGEVVDIRSISSVREDFSSIANSADLSCLAIESEKDLASGNFRAARKLSSKSSFIPDFPTSAEISVDSNVHVSVRDVGQSWRERINRRPNADFLKNKLPVKDQDKLLKEGSAWKTAKNFPRLSPRDKDRQQHGETALFKAVHSAKQQQGSPWTIEFLNRIREKSRLLHQSLPRDISPRCFSYPGNMSKVAKRKSPSILDFYRYQGGCTPRKVTEQKRQRRSTQPSTSSKNERTSASFLPTWTPADKRARQKLSFSTGGGGGQSKLVWSDNDAQLMDRRFYQ